MAKEEPTRDEPLEYICIHCWKGFRGDASNRDSDGESLICPHCDTMQPTVDEILSSDFETHEAHHAASSAPSNAAVDGDETFAEEHLGTLDFDDAPAHSPIPENVVPLPRPSTASDAEMDPEETFRETILAMDPNNAAWKLRSSIGITYNFPGWDAMLRWADGRSGSQNLAVSVLGLDEWRDFDDLRQQLRETPDSRMAYLLARPFESHGTQTSPNLGSSQEAMRDVLTGGSGNVGGRSSASAKSATESRRPGDSKGRSKAAPEREPKRSQTITMRVPASRQQSLTAALFFGLGFLTGAATLFVLWYLRLLEALPLGR